MGLVCRRLLSRDGPAEATHGIDPMCNASLKPATGGSAMRTAACRLPQVLESLEARFMDNVVQLCFAASMSRLRTIKMALRHGQVCATGCSIYSDALGLVDAQLNPPAATPTRPDPSAALQR